MKLKTLGLTAISLGCVGACLAAPTPALAQIQTYYHAGVWDAFSGRDEKGGAVCGVGYTNPNDNRRLSIRFEIGGSETVFSVSKPEWSIPDNTRVAVVMQIGLNTPWTEQATGHGHNIDWPVDQNAIGPFDRQFRGSSSMTVTFPDGNEPPWTISLAGSSAISDTFGRCVRDLTRQVQSEQAGNGAPGPQGGPQGGPPSATQPFSPVPGAPGPGGRPGAPPNGAAPDGSQPDGTQPGGPQPDGTQPDGTQPGR
jgi:hypothetical protein